jgi:hypothetical protein
MSRQRRVAGDALILQKRIFGKYCNKTLVYMPLSFQGFGAVAILAMVLILVAAEGLSYLKGRIHRK